MKIINLLLFLLMGISCWGQILPPPSPPVSGVDSDKIYAERRAVMDCFDKYQEALLVKDGRTATQTLSARTFSYYEDLLEHALYDGKTQLLTLNTIDILAVLSSRLKIEQAQLKEMTAQTYIASAIDLGMIGDSAQLSVLDIATPRVMNKKAEAELFINKRYTGFYMQFYKEKGEWKLDIVPMMHMALSALEQLQAESGLTKEAYIFMLLGFANEGKVDISIWNPLFKKLKD